MKKAELDFILDSTHDGMIAIDRHGTITVFNKAAERIMGIPREKVLGCMAQDTIPGTRLHVVLATGVAEINQKQEFESFSIQTNRMPVLDFHGRTIGAVAVFRDITELEHLTEEIGDIQRMKLLLEAIIDATHDVISVSDPEGKLIMVNQAYTRIIGLAKNEVLGRPATVDIQEDDSMHIHVMKTLTPVSGIPMKVGPQKREMLVNASPVIVNGHLEGSVIVAHDVSEIRRLTEELHLMQSLVRKIQSRYTFDDIVAASPVMMQAVSLAQKAAATPATVLLVGESGIGKELFAHAIHHASQRKNAPFIRVNCAAIPETLLESELFGYEEGSFTGARKGGKKGLFEEASPGTIFLDEIGEIPLPIQVKLLRVLQEKEILRVGSARPISVHTRIIAATNRDLRQAVASGSFREDLYYRINVLPISIPPLRDRISEIPYLVRHLLKKLNQEYGRHVVDLSPEAMSLLTSYSWPGNVRELENILARGIISMQFNENIMETQHIPPLFATNRLPPLPSVSSLTSSVASFPTLADTVAQAERHAIITALSATKNNRTAAARLLGLSVRSLYYKMERYQLLDPQ